MQTQIERPRRHPVAHDWRPFVIDIRTSIESIFDVSRRKKNIAKIAFHKKLANDEKAIPLSRFVVT